MEKLGLNYNLLLLDALDDCQKVFFHLLLDSSMQQAFHFFAVLEPILGLYGPINNSLGNQIRFGSLYSRRERAKVYLILREQVEQGLLFLLS